MNKEGLNFGREMEQSIFYQGEYVGTRRADFIIENRVIVEIKALVNLVDVHLAHAKNYVVAYDFPVRLLINFGGVSLQHKMIFNPEYNSLFTKNNSENSKIL